VESEYVGYHKAGGMARNPFKAQRLLYSRRAEASKSWISLQLMNVIERFTTRNRRKKQKVAILVRRKRRHRKKNPRGGDLHHISNDSYKHLDSDIFFVHFPVLATLFLFVLDVMYIMYLRLFLDLRYVRFPNDNILYTIQKLMASKMLGNNGVPSQDPTAISTLKV
jgi:hypothetical protein